MDAGAMQYFFVSGSPKSGTTWLQIMLDNHPEVTCSGEGAFIERLALPLATIQEDYNKYQQVVADRVYGHRSYYPALELEDILPATRMLITTMMLKRLKEGARAVGDKTPRSNLFLNSLHRLFPQARFINIVRHPYDVTVSKLFHAQRAKLPGATTPGSDLRMQLARSTAEDWERGQTRVTAFATKKPGLMVEVRYEDLLDQPETEASRLFAHLGVSTDAAMVEGAVASASFEKLSGGRERGVEDASSFFRKGIAGDWKEHLEPELLKVIDKSCGALMATYGYETASAI
jgi:hypothetical protein